MGLPTLVKRQRRDLREVVLVADVPRAVRVPSHLGTTVLEGLVLLPRPEVERRLDGVLCASVGAGGRVACSEHVIHMKTQKSTENWCRTAVGGLVEKPQQGSRGCGRQFRVRSRRVASRNHRLGASS